jgi:hypothetical protein
MWAKERTDMKENWISVDEFSRRTGKHTSTLYSEICRARSVDPLFSVKYKKEGNLRFINYAWFEEKKVESEKFQERFETAYYMGLEHYGNEYAFAKALSGELGLSPHAVNQYLRDVFLWKSDHVSKRRKEYVEAMEEIVSCLV